jgi:hypothetical protein
VPSLKVGLSDPRTRAELIGIRILELEFPLWVSLSMRVWNEFAPFSVGSRVYRPSRTPIQNGGGDQRDKVGLRFGK